MISVLGTFTHTTYRSKQNLQLYVLSKGQNNFGKLSCLEDTSIVTSEAEIRTHSLMTELEYGALDF